MFFRWPLPGVSGFLDSGAGQVLGETIAVAPAAGVVDQQGVLDAVCGVVDRGWVAGVDDVDDGAVDGISVRVDGDAAVEIAVHGVAADCSSPFCCATTRVSGLRWMASITA